MRHSGHSQRERETSFVCSHNKRRRTENNLCYLHVIYLYRYVRVLHGNRTYRYISCIHHTMKKWDLLASHIFSHTFLISRLQSSRRYFFIRSYIYIYIYTINSRVLLADENRTVVASSKKGLRSSTPTCKTHRCTCKHQTIC